jgi:multiple sugar transport system substrate-binding protein
VSVPRVTVHRRRAVPAALLAVLAVLVALAGCGAATPPPVAELVWATGRVTADGPARAVADAWNRTHPGGPRVRVVPLPESADDQHQQLAVELGAGIPDIDVVDLDVVWTAEFAARGWLTDLSDLRDDVAATAMPVPVASATWDGRLWAVPYTTDTGVLYYRTDLLPGPPPTSWNELVQRATPAARQAGVAPYVVDGAPAEGLVVEYLEYLWGAGGDLTVDGSRVQLDDAAALTALKFMRTGYQTGFFAPDTEDKLLEDARRTFQSGGALFLRSWPYAYRLLDDPSSPIHGHVGVAPLPTFGGRGTVAALGGHNLAVSRFSRAPAAAEDFVRFAGTDLGVQRMLARDWQVAPTATAAYDAATDPALQTVQQVLPSARTRPVTEYWSEMSQDLQQQIVAGTVGRSTPNDAVATMHRLLDATAGSS